MNFKVDAATATALNETFLEIVMAPDFDADALEILNKRKSSCNQNQTSGF